MALILNIDTALETGSVCISKDGLSIAYLENKEQGKQASWIHEAINNLLKEVQIDLKSLSAIGVSNGPGSYTGLRIGLSTAKGICYALNIPLITINTLSMMASAVAAKAEDLICPMIDARRMEVFTALYDKELNTIESRRSLILNENSFAEILAERKILFTGNGSERFKNLVQHSNALFLNHFFNAQDLIPLSFKMFQSSQFADLAYSEPEYVKAVHTT